MMTHGCDSTPRPTQADTLWSDLCAARLRIAELEAVAAGLLRLIEHSGTVDEINGVLTRARAALAKETRNAE